MQWNVQGPYQINTTCDKHAKNDKSWLLCRGGGGRGKSRACVTEC